MGAAEATIEHTRAGIERSHAQSDQASNDLGRTRTLVERGAATVQALERAVLAMRVADRDLRAAEFLNHAAEHKLAQTRAMLAQSSHHPSEKERRPALSSRKTVMRVSTW